MTEAARRVRSWLFAPGHDEKLLSKVFGSGADAVILDLEDAVPPDLKVRARSLVAEVTRDHPCWVRVNRAGTDACRLDLEAIEGSASGVRVPKVESAADVRWVAERAQGVLLDCTIESAAGVLNTFAIASTPECAMVSLGSIDLAFDLGAADGLLETLHARSSIVVACRTARKPPPSDGVYAYVPDDEGLRRATEAAKRLGFFGKSAIHPRQVPIINDVFTPTADEIEWARRVIQAFEASGGAPLLLPDGSFVDLPVAERARSVLAQA